MDLSTPISATTDLGFFDPSTRRAAIEALAAGAGITLDPDQLDLHLDSTAVVIGPRPSTLGELLDAVGRAFVGLTMGSVIANTPPEEA